MLFLYLLSGISILFCKWKGKQCVIYFSIPFFSAGRSLWNKEIFNKEAFLLLNNVITRSGFQILFEVWKSNFILLNMSDLIILSINSPKTFIQNLKILRYTFEARSMIKVCSANKLKYPVLGFRIQGRFSLSSKIAIL